MPEKNEKTEKNDPSEERFWLLVSLKLAGEATPDELTELAALLKNHPEWTLRMELFTNIWQEKHQKQSETGPAFNRHLQRLSTHLANPVLQYENREARETPEKPENREKSPKSEKSQTPENREVRETPEKPQNPQTRETPKNRETRPNRLTLQTTLSIAAAILGAVLLLTIYQHKSQPQNQGLNTVTTRPGSRSKLQLPDGTLVWLNADSKLTYKIDEQSPTREVTLLGEAYFDVAHDKNHPFLIHTPVIDIRVLGTSFNVQCYGNDKHTETSLFEGFVEVTMKNNAGKKIILQPSEKLIVQNNEMTVTNVKTKLADPDEPLMTLGKVHYEQQDSTYVEMLWTKNKLAFDNRSLEEIAHQIERWYGAKITFTDDKLKTVRFSGVFEDESLNQIMEALQMTGGFHYTIHKKVVTIMP